MEEGSVCTEDFRRGDFSKRHRRRIWARQGNSVRQVTLESMWEGKWKECEA